MQTAPEVKIDESNGAQGQRYFYGIGSALFERDNLCSIKARVTGADQQSTLTAGTEYSDRVWSHEVDSLAIPEAQPGITFPNFVEDRRMWRPATSPVAVKKAVITSGIYGLCMPIAVRLRGMVLFYERIGIVL